MQPAGPVYAPKGVRFYFSSRLGTKQLPISAFASTDMYAGIPDMGGELWFGPAIAAITTPQEADCAWVSPVYPMAKENRLQRFPIPPTLCDGGFFLVRHFPGL